MPEWMSRPLADREDVLVLLRLLVERFLELTGIKVPSSGKFCDSSLSFRTNDNQEANQAEAEARGSLHGVAFVMKNFEDGIEARDFEETLDPFGRIQEGHVSISAPD